MRPVGLIRVRARDVFRHDGRIINVNDVLLLRPDEARRLIAAGLVGESAQDLDRLNGSPRGRWCNPEVR